MNSNISYVQFIIKSIEFKILFVLTCAGLLAPLLANQNPVICIYKGEIFFPAIHPSQFLNRLELDTETKYLNGNEIKNLSYDFVVWPLIPFSTGIPDETLWNEELQEIDLTPENQQKSSNYNVPTQVHLLGTNYLGVDLAADLLHGLNRSLFIALSVCFFSFLIGLVLGSLAGNYYSSSIKISTWDLLLISITVLLFYFYFTFFIKLIPDSNTLNVFERLNGVMNETEMQIFILGNFILIVFLPTIYFLCKLGKNKIAELNLISLEIKTIFNLIINLYFVIPPFMICILLANKTKSSLLVLTGFLSIFYGIEVARFFQVAFQNMMRKGFFISADALGYSFIRKITIHLLPNVFPNLLTVLINIITVVIVTESSLSYMGIGTSPDEISLGKIINEFRTNQSNYFLILGPCFLIFILLFVLNRIAEKTRKFYLRSN